MCVIVIPLALSSILLYLHSLAHLLAIHLAEHATRRAHRHIRTERRGRGRDAISPSSSCSYAVCESFFHKCFIRTSHSLFSSSTKLSLVLFFVFLCRVTGSDDTQTTRSYTHCYSCHKPCSYNTAIAIASGPRIAGTSVIRGFVMSTTGCDVIQWPASITRLQLRWFYSLLPVTAFADAAFYYRTSTVVCTVVVAVLLCPFRCLYERWERVIKATFVLCFLSLAISLCFTVH